MEDVERGRFGLGDEGDRRYGFSLLYEDARLRTGLVGLEDAGDC